MVKTFRKIIQYFPFIRHYIRINHIFSGFDTESYYPDSGNSKNKITKIIDYLYIFFILKFMPSNYHLYGFDIKSRKDFKNYLGCINSDPYPSKQFYPLFGRNTVIIDDKYIFNIICNHYNIPVAKSYGQYPNGINKRILKDIMDKNSLKEVILKPRFGAYGLNIFFMSLDDLDDLDRHSIDGSYIVEERIKQNVELDKINPNSVNSIRIITVLCSDGSVEYLGAMLKTSSTSLSIDNFSTGGIVVGIDIETGRLKKDGIIKYFIDDNLLFNSKNLKSLKQNLKTQNYGKVVHTGKVLQRHPVTNIKFYNFQIPFWNEVKETIKKAHNIFFHIKSVGWDIAIGPEGPILIEGNRLWGTAGIQAANGGLLTSKNRLILKKVGLFFNR